MFLIINIQRYNIFVNFKMFYKAFTLNRLSSIQILNKLVMFSMYHLQVYASQKVKMLTLKFSIMID